ncbi:protein draper-like isoform X2 [Ruditapes philippinarum]|uniref:protein draper-like isoform X2 n=1 Tax=Ruditapes philippinarum TaxID=129788 RepID=UPI00295BE5A6|nr:protein draper-like isoform X2 [Ruditapes philippinarum]
MMGITATVFFLLLCHFGSSTQGCTKCECCKNEQQICDLSKNCTYDCIAGHYGENCTEECLDNCTTCVNGTECTECKPGYYSAKCNKPCWKGCKNNTCSISSGECSCKSANFINGTCQNCSGNKYGDECNKTCPGNCSTCISDAECTLCLNSMFYGSHCQNSCSIGCKEGMCDKDDGHCIDVCKSGFSGDKCDSCVPGLFGNNCKLNCGKGCANNTCLISSGKCPCKSTNFTVAKCDACSDDKYGDECNKTCPINCGTCISDTACSWCKNRFYHGSYCQYRCSPGCDSGRCNQDGNCIGECKPSFSGDKCDKCSPGLYGGYCDLNCTENCSKCVSENNCTECKPGFYGETCTAIKGAASEEKKSLVVIASSAGAGVAVIVLLVILVICLIKRNRRQKLSAHTKCQENDYALDMKEIPKQIDDDKPGVIYAKSFKPKQEAGGDAGKDYKTEYDDDHNIPAIDNGYTAVNTGTSANEQNKTFEVCDIAYDNKSYKPLGGNDDYAVVNKGKSTVKENECIEEMYDTTHDNKKNKHHFNSNNDYAVLSVRSDNTESNLAQPDDVYDSAEGGKHKTMSHPSNDYAVFNSNNGDKHGNDKANTLYDTATDKKMQPGNNDYDFCELDTD